MAEKTNSPLSADDSASHWTDIEEKVAEFPLSTDPYLQDSLTVPEVELLTAEESDILQILTHRLDVFSQMLSDLQIQLEITPESSSRDDLILDIKELRADEATYLQTYKEFRATLNNKYVHKGEPPRHTPSEKVRMDEQLKTAREKAAEQNSLMGSTTKSDHER